MNTAQAHTAQSIRFNVFADEEQLLDYYKVQADDFRMRHTAIWTEIQHYTWVLSVLLGVAPVSAVTQPDLTGVQLRFLLFLPVLGFFIAMLAFLIIRRDFVYYSEADARLLFIEKQLGVLEKGRYLDGRLRRAKGSDFSVEEDVKAQNRLTWKGIIRPKIRFLIQATFLIYAIASLAEAGYFIYLIR